jgi:hypothetical protein
MRLKPVNVEVFVTAQLNLNSTQPQLKLGVTKYLVGPPPHPTPPPPGKLLRHFQTTQEADFRYATLF